MQVVSRTLLCASLLACAVAACAVSGASAPTPLYLTTTSTDSSNGIHTDAYTFDLSSGNAAELRQDIRPVFPAPSTVYRDSTLYVPSNFQFLLFHQEASSAAAVNETNVATKTVLQEDEYKHSKNLIKAKKAKAKAAALAGASGPVSEFWGYSLLSNSSTYLYPVSPFSIACTAYDPILDWVFALSSLKTASGQWNITLMTLEYNGDYYSYAQSFYSHLLDDPTGSVGEAFNEFPCRPACAYDNQRALFSYHFPSNLGPGGGQLYTVAVSVNGYSPVGTLKGQYNWPPVNGGVLGIAYSPAEPGQMLFVSNRTNGIVAGFVDPLTGIESNTQQFAADTIDYVTPRVFAPTEDSILHFIESQMPWRYTQWNFGAQGTVEGNVNFPSSDGSISVLGLASS